MSDFRVYDPNEFFQKFVEPTYQDYLAEPLQHHRVKNAAAQLDTLAERMWNWWQERDALKIRNVASPRAYRELLAREGCPDFQIVWDLHDAHKHVELTRGARIVTSASQSGLTFVGGAFDPDAFDPEAFDCGVETFLVRLPDGAKRNLAEVFSNVHSMWQHLLSES